MIRGAPPIDEKLMIVGKRLEPSSRHPRANKGQANTYSNHRVQHDEDNEPKAKFREGSEDQNHWDQLVGEDWKWSPTEQLCGRIVVLAM